MSKEIDYGPEYENFQNKKIPGMWSLLDELNDRLEARYGYIISEEILKYVVNKTEPV